VDCASSNSKPEVRFSTGKLSVRFAEDRPFCFQIKHLMKTSFQTGPIHPALFQIAARIEAPMLPRVSKSAPLVDQKVWKTCGIDAEKSHLAETTKSIAQRRAHFPENAGKQTGV
jgi:hypothetical protein